MAYIEERKRQKGTVYRAKVRLKGYPPQDATFDRKSDAMRWAEETEHALLNNLPLPGEELPRDDKNIADAVVDYLAHTETLQKRSRHTIANDRLTGKRLIDRFGKTSLRKLTREDIELYKEDRLEKVGPSSVRQDMSMLSRIYEMARIRWKMDELDYPGKNIPLPSPPPNREIIITEDQIKRLLEECEKSKNKTLYPLVSLLLETGMRPEEAVLLRWWQIDFAARIIMLQKTKTTPRRVPVSDASIERLAILKKESVATAENDLVFVTPDIAGKDKPVRHYRRAFEQACIRAGINRPLKRDVSKKAAGTLVEIEDAPRVTLYTLRHSAATYLLMHGADIRTVADILGHENISMTMKYTHMVDSHKLAAVNNPNLPWMKKTEK
jgi:integrase